MLDQQIAFDTRKTKLYEQPILCYPDFNKIFVLTTDASNEGLGVVLSEDGQTSFPEPLIQPERIISQPRRNSSELYGLLKDLDNIR